MHLKVEWGGLLRHHRLEELRVIAVELSVVALVVNFFSLLLVLGSVLAVSAALEAILSLLKVLFEAALATLAFVVVPRPVLSVAPVIAVASLAVCILIIALVFWN
jgi:hypothetical protein